MGTVEWWFSLYEAQRMEILKDADLGDEGAQDAIMDVEYSLDPVGQESFRAWIYETREVGGWWS